MYGRSYPINFGSKGVPALIHSHPFSMLLSCKKKNLTLYPEHSSSMESIPLKGGFFL
jgi:hypothetical protein